MRFSYDVIACVGDRSVCHWHAGFSGEGGAAVELDGTFLCQFADPQTVRSLREWWHVRVTPPAEGAG